MDSNHGLIIVRGRRQAQRERWAKLIAEWDRSRLSGVVFAEERGLNQRALYRWRQRLGRGAVVATGPELIELPPAAASTWAAEVTSRAGCVRLAESASPGWAAALVRELNRC